MVVISNHTLFSTNNYYLRNSIFTIQKDNKKCKEAKIDYECIFLN